MPRAKTITIRAIVEPPSEDDPHWVISAPALHFHVQGDTKREALHLFEGGLVDALAWAAQEGLFPAPQPEMIEYKVPA